MPIDILWMPNFCPHKTSFILQTGWESLAQASPTAYYHTASQFQCPARQPSSKRGSNWNNIFNCNISSILCGTSIDKHFNPVPQHQAIETNLQPSTASQSLGFLTACYVKYLQSKSIEINIEINNTQLICSGFALAPNKQTNTLARASPSRSFHSQHSHQIKTSNYKPYKYKITRINYDFTTH